MRTEELHVHSTFCDGDDTPEQMVLAAIDKGLSCIGFTSHSFTPIDTSYCLQKERYPEYKAEIRRLQQRYGDRIRILCGIEQDYYSGDPVRSLGGGVLTGDGFGCSITPGDPTGYPEDGFDYVIGSLHYLPADGGYYPLDLCVEDLRETCERHFGGDGLAMALLYYELEAHIIEKTDADIIGHFDFIMRYNEDHSFFDPADPRYIAAWQRAADILLRTGKPFEINTAGMFRGLRSEPYPAPDIQAYLRARGAGFIPTNDCHCREAVGWEP